MILAFSQEARDAALGVLIFTLIGVLGGMIGGVTLWLCIRREVRRDLGQIADRLAAAVTIHAAAKPPAQRSLWADPEPPEHGPHDAAGGPPERPPPS